MRNYPQRCRDFLSRDARRRGGLLQGSSSCRRGFISRGQRAGALCHGKGSQRTSDGGNDRRNPVGCHSAGQSLSTRQSRQNLQTESNQSSPKTTPRVSRSETTHANPKSSSSARGASAQTAFPTAKAVPEKPGYVFSPFDSSGRYVDVSGYASGTKVKDPWTDKIFVVP
jgi:hypothetical protein